MVGLAEGLERRSMGVEEGEREGRKEGAGVGEGRAEGEVEREAAVTGDGVP